MPIAAAIPMGDIFALDIMLNTSDLPVMIPCSIMHLRDEPRLNSGKSLNRELERLRAKCTINGNLALFIAHVFTLFFGKTRYH